MPTPDLDAVVAAGRQAIADAHDLDALREAEQAHLSRRSPLGEVQRSLGGRDEAARRDLGRRVNQARTTLQAELAARREALEAERDQALLEAERVDVTLPGRVPPRGRSTRSPGPPTRSSTSSSASATGSPRGRRSRPTGTTSRPSTSPPTTRPGPCRTASTSRRATGARRASWCCAPRPRRSRSGPCRPGRRRCTSSPRPLLPGRHPRRHVPVFNQVEVLAVDRGLTMADMKGTLLAFARAYFGEERDPPAPLLLPVRRAGGRGRRLLLHLRRHRRGLPDLPRRGAGSRLLGAGMVHPSVLGPAATTPRRSPASPPGPASSGPTCSAPAWPTCAP